VPAVNRAVTAHTEAADAGPSAQPAALRTASDAIRMYDYTGMEKRQAYGVLATV